MIMFTGIITAMGRVSSVLEKGGDLELGIDAAALDLHRIALGDSVSVQGTCLTVTRKEGTRFYADVSRETISKTTLGARGSGSKVNLEPSLRAGEPLGGHWVSGHIDAMGKLRVLTQDARSWRMQFELPASLMRFVAPKGSICVDGVSLTVNNVGGSRFEVNVIPHTLNATTLGELRIGDSVNVEIDVIARYLDRLANFGKAEQ
jgi:riboflavin synthase